METFTQGDVFLQAMVCTELGSHSSLTLVAELTVTAYAGTFMKTPAIERAPGIL